MQTPEQMLQSEQTHFTLDNMGRWFCNTLQEALESSSVTVAGHSREFDVIVIGGGTFGAAVAQRLFQNDKTHSRRILVLEAGPFVLPEHVQNMAFMGGIPDMRSPWKSHVTHEYKGLLFAVGGRSLSWGGWSPELLDEETADWPPSLLNDLRQKYFREASDLIGVSETNDFIYGELHGAMRRQLHDGLAALAGGNPLGLTLSSLPDHPAVRYSDSPVTTDQLREWLNLPSTDTTPRAELLDLFKLEAPLAVQSVTEPGQFPANKFSTVPMLTQAARLASVQADGTDVVANARKRLMVVPKVNVLDLETETLPDNSVRVTGVRVWDNGTERTIRLAPPSVDRESAVVIALGTVESTRLALLSFKDSLSWRAASRMGRNLMAHLRSNYTIRLPREAISGLTATALQVSALFVKGRTIVDGKPRHFHFQITATGAGKLTDNSELELFKKIPTLEHFEALMLADDRHVVVTIRGIGEMTPHNPDSYVSLHSETEFGRAKADVSLGNSHAEESEHVGSSETKIDREIWKAMDKASDQLALLLAAKKPFEILTSSGAVMVPANATADDLARLHPWKDRRDRLGTTHHDAGTLWMSEDAKDGVTDEFGCIHDTRNCYVASPALFPTVGSPNPMLTGVALARRTADRLAASVLPSAEPFAAADADWKSLFDGTVASFKNWRKVGPVGCGFAHLRGELISYGNDLGLLFYAREIFGDFTLRLQFRIFDRAHHNSGVFVRIANPLDRLSDELTRRAEKEGLKKEVTDNPAWRAVFSGFEIQIDDHARGDSSKDFHGIKPEPDGLWKNRTGAIYKIPAGDRIWHQNRNEERLQEYKAGPALHPGAWYTYEIDVHGDIFNVSLTNTSTGERERTTQFRNFDRERGSVPGYIGIQSYPGATVAFRHIEVKPAPIPAGTPAAATAHGDAAVGVG